MPNFEAAWPFFYFERMHRACPRLPVSSLESISKCAVDSVRVAELDNERARARVQRAKILLS